MVVASVIVLPLLAHAGGSNYGVAPGARPDVTGKISEWPVPTPQFARDPAPGPNRIARNHAVWQAAWTCRPCRA